MWHFGSLNWEPLVYAIETSLLSKHCLKDFLFNWSIGCEGALVEKKKQNKKTKNKTKQNKNPVICAENGSRK